MAAFADLDWNRIDVRAIVTDGGLAVIDERRHRACCDWLIRHGYQIDTFDCRPRLAVAIPELGRLLGWEQQFGYALDADSCNLNALWDGFQFDTPENRGQVFEIVRADLAWQEDQHWLYGLLSIVQRYSRQELAIGRRFFALLVVPDDTPLIGAEFDRCSVPGAFWSPCQADHEFSR